jgi:hypothetical protein
LDADKEIMALGLHIFGAPVPSPAASGFEFGIWRWVIIIGVGAVVLFYAIKRISDVLVNRKTDLIIRESEKEDDS